MILKRWQKALLLFIFYYALLYIGAVIIMYIEAKGLRKKAAKYDTPAKELQSILARDFNVSCNESNANKILEVSYKLFKESKKRNESEWKTRISGRTLLKWRYFTHVTVTTVGYGDIVPETDGGKIFVIVYAIISIPVNIIFIALLGLMLSDCCRMVVKKVEEKVFRNTRVRMIEQKTFAIMILLGLLWWIIGVSAARSSMGWGWTDSFYAVFIAVSTIGYGDYILNYLTLRNYSEFISWFVIVALALVTAIIDSVSKLLDSGTKVKDKEQMGNKEEDAIDIQQTSTM